jgi:hypothetical protein
MAKKDRIKAEQRRATREGRREAQRREAARRRRRQRAVTWSVAGGVMLAAVLLLAWGGALGPQAAGFLGRRSPPPPGERTREYPGNMHIPVGTRASEYASNPPTGGEHYPSTAPWGVHSQPLPDELIVHNLEHGGIWISYKDPNDAALAGRLAAIAGRYRTKVIVTPRPQNDAPIAVAAWGRLLKLPEVDEEKIVAFINAYRGKIGPEPNAP